MQLSALLLLIITTEEPAAIAFIHLSLSLSWKTCFSIFLFIVSQ